MESSFKSIFDSLRRQIPGVTALFVINPDGSLQQHAAMQSHFEMESFAVEYALLLRIARRASQDAGTGDVDEHIIVSSNAVIVARRLPSDHFAIAVTTAQEHLGRLRYELKKAAANLDRLLSLATSESRTA